MARQRPNPGRPAAADPSDDRRRWSAKHEAHLQQTASFSYFRPSRLKRSATKMPAPLRYTQHVPASRTVRALLAVAAPAYAVLEMSRGTEAGTAIGVAVLLAAVIFAASTFRLTVGSFGLSFDIAGLRQVSSFGFVPLYAIREARIGTAPAHWPKSKLKGGWWPGRRRVSVLHVNETGGLQAFQVWVSDAEAFGTAVLGRPMSDQD